MAAVQKQKTKELEDVITNEVLTQEYTEPTIKVSENLKTKKNVPDWEIRDRVYTIVNGDSPLTFTLQSRHSLRYPLLWFNEETKEQEEIRYATNQNSPLVRDQKGQSTLGHIIFTNGVLNVPKEKQNLQKLLSIYHPSLNRVYTEFNSIIEAEDELDYMELEMEAMNAAFEMDIDEAEAIVRVEVGSRVNKMSSKEIKRDLLLFAKRNPSLFLELANDDNVQLRNIAIRATESGIIKLSHDNRTFMWGENDRKLMTVPFDENPYSAMAAFFKTDEGIEIYQSIEKKFQ